MLPRAPAQRGPLLPLSDLRRWAGRRSRRRSTAFCAGGAPRPTAGPSHGRGRPADAASWRPGRGTVRAPPHGWTATRAAWPRRLRIVRAPATRCRTAVGSSPPRCAACRAPSAQLKRDSGVGWTEKGGA
eukprot:347502-Chlamydomonas_euryale.AAC.5